MATPRKLTKTQQKQLRAALESERAELLAQVADFDAEADISHWRDGGFDDDPADSGSVNVERDRAQSLSSHARRMLAEIDGALVRMEDGSYGTCSTCGSRIDYDRLEALPYATLCLDCKRGEEARR